MDKNNNIQAPPIINIENIKPILRVQDMIASRHFYKEILGFTEAGWGSNDFTSISRNSCEIYLSKGGQGNPGTWIWIGFEGDIYNWYEDLKGKGVTIRQPPTNYSWALEMHVEDPDGHVLRFGTEPNFNDPFNDEV